MRVTGFRPRKTSYHPKPFPSDLRESEWHAVRSLFPNPNKGDKNRRNPVRILLNASLWRLEYQKSLHDLTVERPDMPPWGTIHSFEYRLKARNMWPEILRRIHRTRLIPLLPTIMRVAPAGMLGSEPMRRGTVDTQGMPTDIHEQIVSKDAPKIREAQLSLGRKPPRIDRETAQRIGEAIGVDFASVPLDQFWAGLDVELEHGSKDPQTDVTHDDLIQTGKIALAHLKERPDYYTMLKKVEGEKRLSLNSRLRPSVRNRLRFSEAEPKEPGSPKPDAAPQEPEAKEPAYKPVMYKPGMKKPEKWRYGPDDGRILEEPEQRTEEDERSHSESFSDERGNVVPDLTRNKKGEIRIGRVYPQRSYTYDPSEHANTIAEHHVTAEPRRHPETGEAMTDHVPRDARVVRKVKGALFTAMTSGTPQLLKYEKFVPDEMSSKGFPTGSYEDYYYVALPDGTSYAKKRNSVDGEERGGSGNLPKGDLGIHNGMYTYGNLGDRHVVNEVPVDIAKWALGEHSPETGTLFSTMKVTKDKEAADLFHKALPVTDHGTDKTFGKLNARPDAGPRDFAEGVQGVGDAFKGISRWMSRKDLHGSSPRGEHFGKHFFNKTIGHPMYHGPWREMDDPHEINDRSGWISPGVIGTVAYRDALNSIVPDVVEGERLPKSKPLDSSWASIVDGEHPLKGKLSLAGLTAYHGAMSGQEDAPDDGAKSGGLAEVIGDNGVSAMSGRQGEAAARIAHDASASVICVDFPQKVRPKDGASIGQLHGVRLSCEGHSFSSTQLNLPPDLAASVLAFGQQIPDEEILDLAPGGDGRVPNSHCTLRYGIHTSDVEPVAATLRGHHPAMFTLGPVGAFQSDDKDVLFVEAHGPALHTLNAALGTLEHTDTHKDFNPHISIAYLKPGMAKKYLGNNSFLGKEVLCDYVVFSPSEGNDAFITLDGEASVRMSLVARSGIPVL